MAFDFFRARPGRRAAWRRPARSARLRRRRRRFRIRTGAARKRSSPSSPSVFPSRTSVPAAILAEAQAQFKQGKYAAAAALLSPRAAGAGGLTDDLHLLARRGAVCGGRLHQRGANIFGGRKQFPRFAAAPDGGGRGGGGVCAVPDWPRHDALLEAANGVFARGAADPDNALVINGRLSLAQSKLAQGDFAAAAKYLNLLNPKSSRRNRTGSG